MKITRQNFMNVMKSRGFEPQVFNPRALAIAVRWCYGLALPRPLATWVKAK